MDSAIEKAMQAVRPLIDQQSHTISLATARDKELLKGFRQCDYIEIDSISAGASVQLRFNSLNNPEYEANKYRNFETTPEMPFKKLYITNTAQAGKTLVLKCGGDTTMKAHREAAITEIVNPLAVKDSAGTTIDPSTSTDIAAVATAVGALQAAAETLADVISAVNDVETDVEATKTSVDAVATAVGALQAAAETLADVITAVNAVATAVAAAETDIEATNTALGTIETDIEATNTELAKKPDKATAATVHNVVMTNADAEYSQALPANTKRINAQMRENDTAFRIAYVAGKVATPTAPYYTIQVAKEYYEDTLDLTSKTLYFGCAEAGKTIEILIWT